MDHLHFDLKAAMDFASECNNIGVDLLQAGRETEAIEIFRGAASVMQPAATAFDAQSQARETTMQTLPQKQSRILLLSKITRLQEIAHLVREDSQCKMDVDSLRRQQRKDSHQVHHIRPHFCKSGTTPIKITGYEYNSKSCILNSSIIVFNVGLALQLNGTEQSLLKSAHMFEMAYSLASSCSRLVIATDASDSMYMSRTTKICMASLNNAGLIHYSLCNYTRARQQLNTLYQYAVRQRSCTSPEDSSEIHEFLLNSLLFQEPTIAGAA